MSTRTRTAQHHEEEAFEQPTFDSRLDLEDEITDADIEDFLASQEVREEPQGFFNLPTIAGLATIGVGSAYLLQQLGFLTNLNLSVIFGPWLIGVLIILLGFGVLSWSPKRKARRDAQREAAMRRREEREQQRREQQSAAASGDRARQSRQDRRSTISRTQDTRRYWAKSNTNKKLFGVCGGIGEYFGIDPTIVRIAFVVALVISGSLTLPLYFILAMVLPTRPAMTDLEEIVAQRRRARSSSSDPGDDERVIIIR